MILLIVGSASQPSGMQVLAIAGQQTDPTIVPPTAPQNRPANRHVRPHEEKAMIVMMTIIIITVHCRQLSRADLLPLSMARHLSSHLITAEATTCS